jgi:tRNA nucleotidyltransferase (CCA-adding enzyme)
MYLIDMGASLKLVKSFLETVKEDDQIEIMNCLLLERIIKNIHGHSVLFTYHDLEENTPGLAAVVERIMEIENPDAYFACFYLNRPKTMLIISRSQTPMINLCALLEPFGGGGHKLAASAKTACPDGETFFANLITYLENAVKPALCAKDIMTKNVYTIEETASLLDASRFLESVERTGVPVLNADGSLTGFIGLRDIMKGRKASLMNAPIKAYMSRNLITADSSVTIREIERIFFKHHIGHLPIVDDKQLVGIVTRWDYLQAQKAHSSD